MSTIVVCTVTTPVQLWNIFSTSKRCGGFAKFLLSVSFIYVFWRLLISETRTMVWIGISQQSIMENCISAHGIGTRYSF